MGKNRCKFHRNDSNFFNSDSWIYKVFIVSIKHSHTVLSFVVSLAVNRFGFRILSRLNDDVLKNYHLFHVQCSEFLSLFRPLYIAISLLSRLLTWEGKKAIWFLRGMDVAHRGIPFRIVCTSLVRTINCYNQPYTVWKYVEHMSTF